MERFINVYDVDLKGISVFDENLDVLIPLSTVRKALQMTPTADVVPKSEYDAVVSAVDNSTKEFIKLHDDYQEARREVDKWMSRCRDWHEVAEEKSKLVREIFEEIENIAKTVAYPQTLVNGIIASCVLDGLYLESVDFYNLKKKYTEEKS